jgi:hypothetical protein
MSDPKDLENREFQIAIGILEDSRKRLQAAKFNAGTSSNVSINLGLVAATAALADFRPYLLVLSCGIAAASWQLVVHYNRRMMGARDQAVTVGSGRKASTMMQLPVETFKPTILLVRLTTYRN